MSVVAQPSFHRYAYAKKKKSLCLACRNLVGEAALRHGGSDGDSGLDIYISAMRSRVENTT